jgi:hypothetical protein
MFSGVTDQKGLKHRKIGKIPLGIIFVLISLKYSDSAKFLPAIVKEETKGLHFALLVASVFH